MSQKKNVKELLAESFKELLLECAFEKITIKMITDRAGVIRPTFYNHFADKYEVLEWICYTDIFEAARILINTDMLVEAVKLLFTKLEVHKDFYTRAVKIEGQNAFEEIFYQHLVELFEESFKIKGKEIKGHNLLTNHNVSQYYAKGLTFLIQQWLIAGLPVEAKEVTKSYYDLMSHSLEEIIEGNSSFN